MISCQNVIWGCRMITVGYGLILGFGAITAYMVIKYKVLRYFIALPLFMIAAQAAAILLFGN
ncbi:MAG: hypothetical protein CML20_18750 [Rheinheimera sp.]|nr:hypothetical protein [Rheinheimera sp.]